MGPTWGPYGADRTQVGPMLAPWFLLSEIVLHRWCTFYSVSMCHSQGSTLRRARMPGACRSCPGAHKHLRLRARLGKWFFNLGMYLLSQQYTSALQGLYKFFWACENFCRARKLLEPRARWACKPNAWCQALQYSQSLISNDTDCAGVWGRHLKHNYET